MTFTERLQRRGAEWWGPAGRRWTPRGVVLRFRRRGLRYLYRSGETGVLRHPTDPDHVWRFCRYWQRTLLNKFNSRVFAERHGCRVPALYWYGQRIADVPIDSLPDCYAIRPFHGSSRHGVYVVAADRELMTDTRLPRTQLRDRLVAELGEISQKRLLLEEFVQSPGRVHQLPIEYKFHMFSDRIGAIEAVERVGRKMKVHQQLDERWTPLPEPINTQGTLGGTFDPPRCLDEMKSCARRLALAFGTYVRVDYYETEQGPIFSEFSSMPNGGRDFTSFADEHFGRLWADSYPGTV